MIRPVFLSLLAIATASFAQEATVPLVRFAGDRSVTPTADGGLRPVVGVHNIQVYRANRTAPTHADGLTDTYLHAPMLAYWQGQYWLEYLSGPRSEHEAPCQTSLTTSVDGLTWSAPRIVFPSFPGPDGHYALAHQRMGFYVAPDGRLLVLGFFGTEPSPNNGTGYGRVVREVFADGSFGPIFFIRPNAHRAAPAEFPLPYPLYTAASDAGFIAACEALLADKLMTAQWWEEEQLDDTHFYRFRGKAGSIVTRPDGSHLSIWKNRVVGVSHDRGESWEQKSFAEDFPNNGSKYWLQHTSDDAYAVVLNPTNRNRYPLALMRSADSTTFTDLFAVHGELPDQRFGGYLKNMGPQYVRGIAEGNGTPPDAAHAFPLVYSVNKEDIWFARVPTPISATVEGPVQDDFSATALDHLPAAWNIYSPVWAPVRVARDPADATNAVLSLRDEDPYDYARAVRVFPATHGVKISFRVRAEQLGGRLEIELLDATGLRPVRIALEEDGRIWACHEAQWMDAGTYTPGQWHAFELEIPANPDADRCAVLIDGTSPLPRPAYFTDPITTVERLSFRTGMYRERGYGGRDRPGADTRAPLAEFLIDDVIITPLAQE
ncbi:exo-alpha-sialidase [Actomonas aquatica]|uniref:Exo-alpha-sialidase n=1 Tax=Actomonas aquatica TaxID=2866162 RepID=A0ABZ1CDA3_9BACT|nr:exo-alpha-sialidase [Opitutus sp. WL0086]WRQ88275.1 exo-alpha-sialidase [Opitutus sp. WL0086]